MIHRVLPQINQEGFYAQRDSRSGLDYPVSQLANRRIAIVVPSKLVRTALGIELALFWIVSIIRRMGRPFAELIIVSSDEFRQSAAITGGNDGFSVEQLIISEANSADPFAPLHWRTWSPTIDLSDAHTVVWLGSLPSAVKNKEVLVVNASGWISVLQEPLTEQLSLTGSDFDAAPAAVVFAVSMAAARIFSSAFGMQDHVPHVAFALDSGKISTNCAVFERWFAKGQTVENAAPWKGQVSATPYLRKLLVVSAGGIGGNLCQILCDSFLRLGTAIVVEPDKFELSNLNRAIGVNFQMALERHSKALFAARALQQHATEVLTVEKTYEEWITEEIAHEFRQPGTAVAVGVDQIKTRLCVGSDWPWTLLNGSTSGVAFATSLHCPETGGCIGCWYGQSDAPYAATRAPMACAAGVASPAPHQRLNSRVRWRVTLL